MQDPAAMAPPATKKASLYEPVISKMYPGRERICNSLMFEKKRLISSKL